MSVPALRDGASDLRVIACANPFSSDRKDIHLPAGGTILDMVRAGGIAPGMDSHVVVWICDAAMKHDPVFIPRENWSVVRPKPGTVVTVKTVPAGGGGGGGGKNPLRIVLTIAIMIAAIYTGGLAAGALGFQAGTIGYAVTSAAVGFAVSTVGSLIVNAIAPPPKARIGELGGAQAASLSRSSPTLSITGTQNRANRFGVVPRLYGRHRIYPLLAAHPYSETEGDHQYYRMLFDFGYGPLRLSDMRIGTVPLDHYEGVEVEIRQGYSTDAAVSLYSNTIREDQYSLKVTNWGGTQVLETRSDADEFLIDVAFQGLVRFDSGGSRQSRTVKLRVEYRLAGTSDPLTEHGVFEYTEATEQLVRRGIRIVPPSRGRYAVYFTRLSPDNVEWTKGQFDAAAYWNANPDVAADVYYGYGGEGYSPEDPKAGYEGRAWEHWVNHGEKEGRSFTALNGAVPDGGDASVRDDCFIAALRTVTHVQPMAVSGRCLVALRIRATDQLTGVVDQFSAIGEALLPVWDGNQWTEQATRHPAWAYVDVLRGAANKRAVADSRLDLAAFMEWAASDPDRTFDAVIDYPTTVYELLSDIAAAGRARFGMRDGKFSIVRDVPQTVPVQHFTPRNSFGFKGQRTFLKAAHGLKCRFINPDRDWAPDERIVYDDGYTEQTATQFESLEMFGCTDADQVWRDGRYHMACARLRLETYELSCDIDHLVCTAGDLVRVAHDVPRWGTSWARVKKLTAGAGDTVAGVVLDNPVTMEAGKSYAVRFRHASGLDTARTVQTAAGETKALTFTDPVAAEDAPAPGDLAMFGLVGKETVDLIVKSIRHSGDLRATLTLLDAAPAVHMADSGSIPVHDPQVTPDPTTAAPGRVGFLTLSEIVRFPSGMAVSDVVAQWQPHGGDFPGGYEVYVKDQGRWRLKDVTMAQSATVATGRARGETVEVAVLAVGTSGRKLPLSDASTAVLVTKGDTIAPAAPVDLFVEETADRKRRFWWTNAGGEQDAAGVRLRANLGTSRDWPHAIPLHTGLLGAAPFETDALRYGTWTILAKTVDTSGNESTDSAVAVVGLGDALVQNLVQEIDYRALPWTGQIVNGAIDGDGALLAADSGDLQWSVDGTAMWGNAAVAMWGAASGAMFSGDAQPVYSSDVADMWTAVFPEMSYLDSFTPEASGLFYMDAGGQGNLQIYYRRAFPEIMFPEVAGAMWGTVTDAMWQENLSFVPYTTRVQAFPEPYEIKAVVGSGKTQGRIDTLKAVVDAPDEFERFNDLEVPIGGIRLPIARPWVKIKNVSVTLQDDGGSAETVKGMDKNAALGPLIKCFRQSGGSLVEAAGTIDATIQGYL
jgi:hypothetical protein